MYHVGAIKSFVQQRNIGGEEATAILERARQRMEVLGGDNEDNGLVGGGWHLDQILGPGLAADFRDTVGRNPLLWKMPQ